MKTIEISTDFITLGQFLKYVGIIENGSLAKIFLDEYSVLVNGIAENRRGRKLYDNDEIKVNNEVFVISKKKG